MSLSVSTSRLSNWTTTRSTIVARSIGAMSMSGAAVTSMPPEWIDRWRGKPSIRAQNSSQRSQSRQADRASRRGPAAAAPARRARPTMDPRAGIRPAHRRDVRRRAVSQRSAGRAGPCRGRPSRQRATARRGGSTCHSPGRLPASTSAGATSRSRPRRSPCRGPPAATPRSPACRPARPRRRRPPGRIAAATASLGPRPTAGVRRAESAAPIPPLVKQRRIGIGCLTRRSSVRTLGAGLTSATGLSKLPRDHWR